MSIVITAPARILSLREEPRSVGRLRFAIVPDPRRLRIVGSDLSAAIEVRQHLDSPHAVRGTVIVHELRSASALPVCDVIDGPCRSDASAPTFLSLFAPALYEDDLDAVIAGITRLHDRTIAAR